MTNHHAAPRVREAYGVRAFICDLPAYGPPVSVNSRQGQNRWNDAANLREWRHCAVMAFREAQIPPMPHAHLLVLIIPPDGRRRDSDNYVSNVLKPIKDGLVDVGVVPDDTDRYVTWGIRIAEETTARRGIWRYLAIVSERAIDLETLGLGGYGSAVTSGAGQAGLSTE